MRVTGRAISANYCTAQALGISSSWVRANRLNDGQGAESAGVAPVWRTGRAPRGIDRVARARLDPDGARCWRLAGRCVGRCRLWQRHRLPRRLTRLACRWSPVLDPLVAAGQATVTAQAMERTRSPALARPAPARARAGIGQGTGASLA